jgi:hypothetical protein
MPDALPVTAPFLSKAGRSFASASTVVSGRGCSSVWTMVSPRWVAIRHDLVLETAGLLHRSRLGLRGSGEGVLLVAGDLPALGDVLGGVAHVIAVERVPQPPLIIVSTSPASPMVLVEEPVDRPRRCGSCGFWVSGVLCCRQAAPMATAAAPRV